MVLIFDAPECTGYLSGQGNLPQQMSKNSGVRFDGPYRTRSRPRWPWSRDLRRVSSPGGPARIAVAVGEAHDRLLRAASGAARRRIVIGSNRLGSTARPGALTPSEVAAGRSGVTATVLYTQASGPLKNRHARALAAEAAENGVRLTKTRKIPLHGKFVAWDDDDLVVTSLNWASASADPDFPLGEIGVHIQARGIAADALSRLGAIFPELGEELASTGA